MSHEGSTAGANQPTTAELRRLCAELVAELDAAGCAVSRAVGEMMLLVAEHARDGRSLRTGHGYLISDFPDTERVIATGEPAWIASSEPHGHEAEVRILDELAMSAVLLLAFRQGGEAWGLVEVYRDGDRGFTPDDAAAAAKLVARTAR